MKNMYAKNIYNLDNAIMPNMFTIHNESIYYYDKINSTDGRFCVSKNGKTKVFTVTDNGQAMITHDGKMFSLEIGNNTSIREYKDDGTSLLIAELEGIFFDIKINKTGNYVCLGYCNNNVCIKIIKDNGIILCTIDLPSIVFASCICLHMDNIYLGCFDEDNRYRIVIINYMGNILNKIQTNINAKENIIANISIYKDYIVLLATGTNSNIILLDMSTNKTKILLPRDMGLKYFVDINIYDEEMFILNENNIYKIGVNDILEKKISPIHLKMDFDFSSLCFQTMIFIKGISETKFINTYILTFIMFLTSMLIVNDQNYKQIFVPIFAYIFIFIFSISFISIFLKCLNKSKRIEYLLDIYYEEKHLNIKVHFMIFTFIFSSYTIISIPFYNMKYSILTGIAIAFISLYINKKCIVTISKNKGKYVIELLNDDNMKLSRYLNTKLKKIKSNNEENIYIEIDICETIDDNIIKKWHKSRKWVLNNEMVYDIQNEKLITIIDFSKRDIRYSIYSIIMDYICYIGNNVRIASVEILDYEKNSGMSKLIN